MFAEVMEADQETRDAMLAYFKETEEAKVVKKKKKKAAQGAVTLLQEGGQEGTAGQ